jgi:hypothetical protein
MILNLVSTIYNRVAYLKHFFVQMRRYHGQSLSMPVTTELDDPAPVAPLDDEEDSDEPTRFQLKRPVYERDSPSQVFTVDAEYRKYASGALSSAKMDILRFWEVRSVFLDRTMTHSLIGQ